MDISPTDQLIITAYGLVVVRLTSAKWKVSLVIVERAPVIHAH